MNNSCFIHPGTSLFPKANHKRLCSLPAEKVPTPLVIPLAPGVKFMVPMPPTSRLGERALGVDYGLKRIGLAVSVGVSPRVLPRVEHQNEPEIAALGVAAAAVRTVSDTIVVGLPVDIYGREGDQVEETRTFIAALVIVAPWARIVTVDESLTTVQARQRLADTGVRYDFHDANVDSTAAAILLERYFNPNDARPVLVQRGYGSTMRLRPPVVDRKGFTEWKEEAMARARQSAAHLQKRKKR